MDRATARHNVDITVRIVTGILVAVGLIVAWFANRPLAITIEMGKSVNFYEAIGMGELKKAPGTNYYFSEAIIANTGRRPIKEEDFFDALSVSTTPTNKIVAIQHMGSKPSEFTYEFLKITNGFQLKPLKLNPGDRFGVMIVTESDTPPQFKWTGRLQGRSDIEFRRIDFDYKFVPSLWFKESRILPYQLDFQVYLGGMEVYCTLLIGLGLFILGIYLLAPEDRTNVWHLAAVFLVSICNGENILSIWRDWGNSYMFVPWAVWAMLFGNLAYFTFLWIRKRNRRQMGVIEKEPPQVNFLD